MRHRLLIIPLLSLFVACAQTRDSAPVIVSGRAIMEDGVGIEYRIVGEGPQVVLARASLPDICQFENEWPVNLWPYFDRLLGSQGEYDWRDGLRTLEGPRLVLHGTQDRIAMEHAEEWAKYPNARLIVVEGAAHLPFLEKPQQVLSAIEVFLSGDWPTGARTLSQ